MPTQASAHHLNAYANTSQDIVYLNWSFLLNNVAHMEKMVSFQDGESEKRLEIVFIIIKNI